MTMALDSVSPALSDYSPNSLDALLRKFQESDDQRNGLIKQLVDRCTKLEQQYRDKNDDYDSEQVTRRHWQNMAQDLKRDNQVLSQQADNNPFVLALIDGDGVIFQESLLHAGQDGGSEAAHNLLEGIKKHVQELHPGGASNWSVMVQIYANFDGLSKKLAQVGILKSPQEFHEFIRAFNLNQALFQFIDVGFGKERADHKIKEMFRIFVNNTHCRHIIFGGCHDNGYLNNLEPYKRDATVAPRLSLLESTPAEYGYRNLGFPIVAFKNVFRQDPLPSVYRQDSLPSVHQTQLRPATVPLAAVQNISPVSQSPPAVSTASLAPSSAVSSWATIGGPVKTQQINIAPSSKANGAVRKAVLLNVNDQRMDPKMGRADAVAFARVNQRIKEQKVCNNYHLLGKCSNGTGCGYAHGDRLDAKEQLALRQKARERVCPLGSDCRDVDCFFGHQCPRDVNCFWDNCYFEHLHNLDTLPRMKMYENGEVEILS